MARKPPIGYNQRKSSNGEVRPSVMSVPIIKTRIRVPPLPAWYLPREQLDRRWREWRGKRLVTVTAGAGFGKTSFIAARAAAVPACAWYSLDESDADTATFCTHLQAAVRLALGRGGRPGQRREDAADPNRLVAGLVRLLDDAGETMLVLDDLQLLAGAAEVRRLITRLVRYLPPPATLVLASREPVDLGLSRVRAAGSAGRLTTDDLRFDADEVQALYRRHFPGSQLPGRLCRRVLHLTEGWAAGLEILFQALDAPSPAAVEQALRRLEAAEDGWFPYFAEEVVGGLAPEVRDFLVRSAVLPRMSPALCDRVLGTSGSRRILADLHRRNLFTFVEGERPRTYRYHHLFRDFLRERLVRSRGREEVGRLYRRTGRELERAGAWVEAAAAHSEGGDHEAALRLATRRGEDLVARGQYHTLERALGLIPAKQLSRNPGGLFVLGRLHEIQGRWEEAEAAYRRVLRLKPEPGRRAELMSLVAQLEMRRGDFAAARRRCRRALGESRAGGAKVRSRLLNLLAISACSLGRLDEGEEHFRKALALFRRRSDLLGEGRVRYLLAANVHFHRGEFRRARDEARKALVLFRKLDDPRRICHSLGVLGFVTAGAAREREARELSEEALRLAESLDYPLVEGYCRLTLGRCALFSGDTASAGEHFEAALEAGAQLGETFLRSAPLFGLAETAVTAGNHHQARRHAERALALAEELKDPLLQAQCRVLLGLISPKPGRGRARAHWRDAENALRRIGARFDLHRLLLHRLAAGDADDTEAPRLLAELLAGAAELDHDFLFLVLEREKGIPVLTEAIRRGVETGYAGRLLVHAGRPAAPALARLADDASDEVRRLTVELLAQIGGEEARRALARMSRGTATGLAAAARAAEELEKAPASPLAITALGPLTVTAGERTLTLAQWRSARSRRLFQLLLVHRFRWVPRDEVIEALWPEVDPEKSVNNLRQAIHLLRKLFEPGLDKPGNSAYIRYRNEACRLEGGDGCFYDVAELEQALQQGEQLWNRGHRTDARPHFERVAELYNGSFLEESPYEDFAALERERLRDCFLRGLARLIELGAGVEDWAGVAPLCRRGLEQAPYQEDLHWHLVHALHRLGSRHEALAAYHEYEKAMVRELDLLPSARMQDLVRAVSRAGPR